MSRQIEIEIHSRTTSYPIIIGKDLLQSAEFTQFLKSQHASRYAIITDHVVESLYARSLENHLRNNGLNVSLITFPPGEEYKSRETKEFCENKLLKINAGRDSVLIGIGGGIVSDITGFIASTYCRGIPYVSIPTSLLAMVDASIGGKTGVNTPEGKNLIGTIYQPSAVFIDTSTLKTLPLLDIKNGLAEMIKHGLILNKNYYEFLKNNSAQILHLDSEILEKAIYESVLIKASVVENDETEKGMRRSLNFGHTVAHAIEIVTKHAIPHGRAVAIGMIAESYMAMRLGVLGPSDFDAIREILDIYQIDLTWDHPLSLSELMDVLKRDKKSLEQMPRFVILESIGKASSCDGLYCAPVELAIVMECLKWTLENVIKRIIS